MILITGANGKLGKALVQHFAGVGQRVRAAARAMPSAFSAGVDTVAVGALTGATDWRVALNGVSTVIHCAALTWISPDQSEQSEFRTVNVEATAGLAVQAAAAGVKRLVFISSLTVNGKHSGMTPFAHDDEPAPSSLYSQTKWEAEQRLRSIEAQTGLEVVVIRPPRIIWPELTGNLAVMSKLIARGVPLPFGMLTRNARDNVSAENLIAAVALAASVPGAGGHVLLIANDAPLSTRALVEWLARRLGKPARLLPVPPAMLKLAIGLVPARLLGKLDRREMIDELTLDLRVDTRAARSVLGWVPQPIDS